MDKYDAIGIVLGALIFGSILFAGVLVGRREHS
jgi:hypothetical protein